MPSQRETWLWESTTHRGSDEAKSAAVEVLAANSSGPTATSSDGDIAAVQRV
jgi:hypothetical protein